MTIPDDQKPIFDIKESSFVKHLWFVELDDVPGRGGRGDWMALLFRDDETAPWRTTYRFRYYASSKPFDSGDEKSVYDVNFPPTTEIQEIVDAFDEMAKTISITSGGGKIVSLPIDGDGQRFLEVLTKQDFCHTKLVDPNTNPGATHETSHQIH